MKHMHFLLAASSVVVGMLCATIALAGPGHDHGDAPATTTGKSSPRFEAHSDLFEAVGVLGKDELSLFIDRYKNNEPVLNAKVEMESVTTKMQGKFHAEHGDYSFDAKAFEKPGSYPISLTITAGAEVDILAGNLVVPDPAASHDHANDPLPWKRWLVIAGAVTVLLVGIAAVFNSRRNSRRHTRKVSHV
jgi:hypothetical protein